MRKHKIDNLDKKILRLISKDARIAFQEISRECNVSGAAVHQRFQTLKKNGVVKGSQFIVDNYKIGYQTCAYIGVVLSDNRKFSEVVKNLERIKEIVECHYVTGKYSVFIKVYAKDNKHLLQIIVDRINVIDGIANTETFQMSMDELFNRQLDCFEIEEKTKKDNKEVE